jgi:hypothetical protein
LDPVNGIFQSKIESNGDKASPCFRTFWIVNLSDRFLPIWTVLQVSFKHILVSPDSFQDIFQTHWEYCIILPS